MNSRRSTRNNLANHLIRGIAVALAVIGMLALAAPSHATMEGGAACVDAMGTRCLDHMYPTTGHVAKKCSSKVGSGTCATCQAATSEDICKLDGQTEGVAGYTKVVD